MANYGHEKMQLDYNLPYSLSTKSSLEAQGGDLLPPELIQCKSTTKYVKFKANSQKDRLCSLLPARLRKN